VTSGAQGRSTARPQSDNEAPSDGHASRTAEVETKLDQLRLWLERKDHSACLLTSQANFAWITGGGHSHVATGEAQGVASVLVTDDAAYLITPNIELRRLTEEETAGLPFQAVEFPWHARSAISKFVAQLFDSSRAVSDVEIDGLGRVEPDMAQLRYTLLTPELERYRALGRAAAQAVERACLAARPDDSELEVAARVSFECWTRDILPLVNLAAADGRIALYRHPIPTSNRVKSTLLVALTGRRHGLHASLTRMVSFGPPDAELVTRHHAVTRVDACEILATRPGRDLSEVMKRGVDQYAAEGFPEEWKLHHQGGLTGYAGREIFATPSSRHRIGGNQVFAWNPSITRVKSEDTVFVGDDDQEVLTRSGHWPERDVRLGPETIKRPALLVAAE
jgi:Xaa-Pro aminopeptidase